MWCHHGIGRESWDREYSQAGGGRSSQIENLEFTSNRSVARFRQASAHVIRLLLLLLLLLVLVLLLLMFLVLLLLSLLLFFFVVVVVVVVVLGVVDITNSNKF